MKQRSEPLRLRVSDAVRARVERDAAACGLSPTAYVERLLCDERPEASVFVALHPLSIAAKKCIRAIESLDARLRTGQAVGDLRAEVNALRYELGAALVTQRASYDAALDRRGTDWTDE